MTSPVRTTAVEQPLGDGSRQRTGGRLGTETYERRLQEDPRWAMSESTRFFEGTSKLHETVRRIGKALDELGVPYVVIGGLALTAHGYARMTDDVDILVTKDGSRRLLEHLEGRGYRRAFAGSKNLRDTESSVKIEFVITGAHPGSGKPQPFAFPDPLDTSPIEIDGVKFIGLERLVELKLASGMTGGPDRAKDHVDVQTLIARLSLDRTFARALDPYVRPTYERMWDALHAVKRRYKMLWRNKHLTVDCQSIGEMAEALRGAAEELQAMIADGVVLDREGGAADDYASLVTTDPDVARKYDMHPEDEFED